MKKIGRVLFLCGMIAVLTACGQEAAPALAQDISLGADSAGSEERGTDREEGAAEVPDQESAKEEEGVFRFAYEGAILVPGELVDHAALPKCSHVAEVPSCAFGGNDKVYQYKAFELTAYLDGDEERVYSIYFTDPNLPTTEGLRLGDTVDDMKSLYGENYEAEGTACTYTKGETLLIIITKNDVITGIEYRLDR